MQTFIILSNFAPDAFKDPKAFKQLSLTVSEKIKNECPGVVWKNSYTTLGRFDVINIVESDDTNQVEKAAMLIRSYANSTTETLIATPWKDFLDSL
ncbi:MAG: GYD domain-containing protein [Desulfobacterales bacterium]|nr:GYD domain-containing protein [Desulfobacterales bacterium]